ncbi:hypothetical protein HUG10_09470 [Halorarum halophilum]|uniref:Uncharacterized protein n=1 Tax=Halorarum halophilum TaxID=2743090 RepID=A0A7D5GEW9_9EURY|nr:hypothetical protein [Halobaculum halophilum]QLG27768.1 hypothetical protein HUG10_09470 [Halobaculum halophilum]
MAVPLHVLSDLPLALGPALALIVAGTVALAIAAYDAYRSYVAGLPTGGEER